MRLFLCRSGLQFRRTLFEPSEGAVRAQSISIESRRQWTISVLPLLRFAHIAGRALRSLRVRTWLRAVGPRPFSEQKTRSVVLSRYRCTYFMTAQSASFMYQDI